MDVHTALVGALVTEVRRRVLGELVPRVRKCLALLTQEEIWERPNAQTVSVGNLVLHVCGNARQWMLSALGGEPDVRRRQAEFDEPGPLATDGLLQMLDEIAAGMTRVLDAVTPEQLLQTHRVQGFDETGTAILVHVTEHFSYHVGQIAYAVKSRKAVDLGYYAGVDLSRT
jgi:uncharacterized damage-inducible protein DinB